MKKIFAFAFTFALGALASAPALADHKGGDAKTVKKAEKNPIVVIKTSMGTIKVELFNDKAPLSTKNFLQYTDEKFYDGTIFHRVINGFMVQGGGFDEKLAQKPTHAPVKNEAANGLKNDRGTLSMARTSVPDSATAQFYINVVDNGMLNFRDPSPSGIGYAVFGKVVEGMDVVDKIKAVKTGMKNGMGDVPEQPVKIESVRRAGAK